MKKTTKQTNAIAEHERRTSAIILRAAQAYRHDADGGSRMLELLAIARLQGADVYVAMSAVLDAVHAKMKADNRGAAHWRPVDRAKLTKLARTTKRRRSMTVNEELQILVKGVMRDYVEVGAVKRAGFDLDAEISTLIQETFVAEGKGHVHGPLPSRKPRKVAR